MIRCSGRNRIPWVSLTVNGRPEAAIVPTAIFSCPRPAASALLGAPSARVRLRVLGRVAWCTGGCPRSPKTRSRRLSAGAVVARPVFLSKRTHSGAADQAALGHEETIQDVSGDGSFPESSLGYRFAIP